ncbi:hypothetical protein AAF712_002671 [Marasmius tenuissimus]|uniref:DUF7330 domain-containing protein n=1 Tax=Marasmius tenuissimus TaxID=585030 RepID=A0ABR3A8E9_9AGAR
MKTQDTPPPIYTADSTGSGSDGLQKTPCNYTRLIRENGPIEETFVVDHTIRVNEALLSPLTDTQRQAEGGRNNLYVKAKSGHVDVTIHVVEDNPASMSNTPIDLTKSLPSTLKLVVESDNGDVVVRLVLCFFATSYWTRKLTRTRLFLIFSVLQVPEKDAAPYISL